MAGEIITAEEATGSILQQIEDAFFDIPFENSDYQNRAFVMAAQQTPGRAYRAIGLRMFAKIRAIKEYKFSQGLLAIDIEERDAKIADPDTGAFDRRRMEIENLRARDGQKWGEKLLNDALCELNCLYREFQRLPKYTRAQFEAEERRHFEAKLRRQIECPGPLESLANVKIDAPGWDKQIESAVDFLESN